MIPLLLACGGAPSAPTATEPAGPVPEAEPAQPVYRGRPEVTAELVADLAAKRDPSDGGGSVALANDPGTLVVGGPGRFELVYTVGPLGIAEGGAVVFQSPPFWGWSAPQLVDPERPGYTELTVPEGLTGRAFVADQGTLVVPVEGRALTAGETVRIVYGAGVGARVDRFADRAQTLWVAVDGNGDGIRKRVDALPTVAIGPGPPVRLHCVVPTTAEPGAPYALRLALLDALGDPADAAVDVRLEGPGLPELVHVAGTARVEGRADEGVHRIRATGAVDAGALTCLSNPMVVRAGAPRIQWMDLQVHTGVSDGTGTPEDAYRYGRDVAGLDGMAVTDHDHWGMRFLDADPERWDAMVALADRWNASDFVVVPAYEWTSWTYGHRHVLMFGDDRTLFSSVDPDFDTPEELHAAAPASDVIVPHHPAGGAVAVDWSHQPEPDGIVELCSVHGSSESPDTPGRIYDPVDGSWVRDALARGLQPGFICSTDGHDGHPGLSQLAGPHGGLAAIVDAAPGREGLLEALRARRVYGTNGPRILLRVEVDGAPMGSVVAPGSREMDVRVVAEGPLASLELIRGGAIVASERPGSALVHHVFALPDLAAGEYAYVRAVQSDGGAAWSSPIYVGNAGEPGGVRVR